MCWLWTACAKHLRTTDKGLNAARLLFLKILSEFSVIQASAGDFLQFLDLLLQTVLAANRRLLVRFAGLCGKGLDAVHLIYISLHIWTGNYETATYVRPDAPCASPFRNRS